MQSIILSEVRLGMVQFDWTFLFQIVNTLLWILIIYAVYRYMKGSQTKKCDLKERVTKLEDELERLNGR